MPLVISWVGTTPSQRSDATHPRQAGGGSEVMVSTYWQLQENPKRNNSAAMCGPAAWATCSLELSAGYPRTRFRIAWEGRWGGKGHHQRLSRKHPLGDHRLAIQSFEEPRYFPPRLHCLFSEIDALLLGFLMLFFVQMGSPSNSYTLGVASVKYQGRDFQ